MADEQHDIEITSKTTTTTTTAIDEDDLELSLSLRPINSFSSYNPKNLLQTSSLPSSNQILTKRDAQALRRHEAMVKRDLKRKAQASVFVANKAPNLGFQLPPPWLGWNAGCFSGGLQGQNGKFASEGKDCGSFSSGSSSSGNSNNHQSISGPGANSSDAGSHSSHAHSQLTPPSVPSTSPSGSNKLELMSSSTRSSKSPEGATTSSNTTCQQNGASPNCDKDSNTTPQSVIPKECKGETRKPPRPNGVMGQEKILFSEMPCVSTTGNGPNGKTVTGFLYKYTKAEVSIICICHGSSFTPAEFVEHAGGVDVEYPLRHIRVVPFSLG